MELRPTKSADELRQIIFARLRRHSECSTVQSVTVVPQERSASHHANWEASFVVDGPAPAPAKAFEIARQAGMEFDLET
jgi:hypothetical protein